MGCFVRLPKTTLSAIPLGATVSGELVENGEILALRDGTAILLQAAGAIIGQLLLPDGVNFAEGAIITKDMVAIRKPGTGLAPKRIGEVIGSRAIRFLSADTVITEADLSIGPGDSKAENSS